MENLGSGAHVWVGPAGLLRAPSWLGRARPRGTVGRPRSAGRASPRGPARPRARTWPGPTGPRVARNAVWNHRRGAWSRSHADSTAFRATSARARAAVCQRRSAFANAGPDSPMETPVCQRKGPFANDPAGSRPSRRGSPMLSMFANALSQANMDSRGEKAQTLANRHSVGKRDRTLANQPQDWQTKSNIGEPPPPLANRPDPAQPTLQSPPPPLPAHRVGEWPPSWGCNRLARAPRGAYPGWSFGRARLTLNQD